MWIGHPFPELRLFWKFDLENQRSRSWVGSSSKSQCGSNILWIHIPFVPCQSALPFLRYSIFKIWPWKSRVKVMGEVTVQSHNVGLTSYRLTSLSFHVKRPSQSWVTTFFKIWPWKSRVKVMGGVTVQSHNVGLTSYRFTSLSFHVNRPSHSWDTVFSKYDLEKSRVKVKWPWRCTTTGPRCKCKQDSVGVRRILVVPRDSGGASTGFCWCILSDKRSRY